MSIEIFRQNWPIAIAAVLFAIVGISVIAALYRRSSSRKLRKTAKGARTALKTFTKAQKAVAAAEKRVTRLQGKLNSVKPRVLDKSKEALKDAKALEKIASDQVLVADNHLRLVIHQDFPPARHEALRRKYLPNDKPDAKPFSF